MLEDLSCLVCGLESSGTSVLRTCQLEPFVVLVLVARACLPAILGASGGRGGRRLIKVLSPVGRCACRSFHVASYRL